MFSRKHLLLSYALTTILSLAFALPEFVEKTCMPTGNYTANSAYQKNLDTLLSYLSPKIDKYGFYSSAYGQNSDRAYAMALCRGDARPETCRRCISNSTTKLTQVCPNHKEAVGWYDYCMLRFSSKPMSLSMAANEALCKCTDHNATDQFNDKVMNLLGSLRGEAAAGGPHLKFAARNTSGPDLPNIYGLVQCTPDLSEQQCDDCLFRAINYHTSCCGWRTGGRVLLPSCNTRYDMYKFFEQISVGGPPPADEPPWPGPPPLSPGRDDSATKIIIIIVVSFVSFIIALLVCIRLLTRKWKKRRPDQRVETATESSNVDKISPLESLKYNFDTIYAATNNFSDSNKLGRGGFGVVYRGRLSNGQEIAVKRLSINSRQGEQEFKNEVMLVAKLQHRNLVRLLGFCLQGTEKLLVYEFVPNSSLDHFLFDPAKRSYLDWGRRYKIIGGIARGLLYLHEDSRLRIIHRDLKASNVLLDVGMNPKISDFGTAKLFMLDETQGSTNRIVGTYGYMAPEYAMHGHFSVKSDVFSFGVLILEIVSGQKNNSFRIGENLENFLSHVWKAWEKGTTSDFIDPMLRSTSGCMREMMRCIHIGLLCVQNNVANRPTMASVVLMLTSLSLTLPAPSEPAFFIHSNTNLKMPLFQENNSGSAGTTESDKSKTKSSYASINEASITELHPR